jgi:hypothetical protein
MENIEQNTSPDSAHVNIIYGLGLAAHRYHQTGPGQYLGSLKITKARKSSFVDYGRG